MRLGDLRECADQNTIASKGEFVDTTVPYMPSVKNLHKILDAIQHAGVPEVFNLDFLSDLGFSSSNDRSVIKLLKYLGMLDGSGRPQDLYRQFVDHTKAKAVLAQAMRSAFDDLFVADKNANAKSVESLKGWFKSKTGVSDAVATKMATQFKALAQYADFSAAPVKAHRTAETEQVVSELPPPPPSNGGVLDVGALGLVYRLEIHLPDTQNVETFRAIFRALREELMA